MADRHTIVVRVKNGKVFEVLFCDCCPSVTLEVRAYTDSISAAAVAIPAWHMDGGTSQSSQFKRDEDGVYEPSYYEPDVDSE
jgi:hypothetical protein